MTSATAERTRARTVGVALAWEGEPAVPTWEEHGGVLYPLTGEWSTPALASELRLVGGVLSIAQSIATNNPRDVTGGRVRFISMASPLHLVTEVAVAAGSVSLFVASLSRAISNTWNVRARLLRDRARFDAEIAEHQLAEAEAIDRRVRLLLEEIAAENQRDMIGASDISPRPSLASAEIGDVDQLIRDARRRLNLGE